ALSSPRAENGSRAVEGSVLDGGAGSKVVTVVVVVRASMRRSPQQLWWWPSESDTEIAHSHVERGRRLRGGPWRRSPWPTPSGRCGRWSRKAERPQRNPLG